MNAEIYWNTQVVIPIYLLCYNQRNKTLRFKQYRISPNNETLIQSLIVAGTWKKSMLWLGETSYVQWTGRQQSVPQWLYCDLVWPGVVNTRLACGCGSTQTTTCGYDNNPVTTPSVVSSIEMSGTASRHKKTHIQYLKKEWKKLEQSQL